MSITYAKQIIDKLKDLDSFVLMIDGNAGSGKTTLSCELANILNATLIHIDNFYLPISKRKEDWFETSGGNIDFVRINEEILIPYKNKENLKHREFKPRTQSLVTYKDFSYNPKLIIEGSYSMHPLISDISTHKLFLECDDISQEKRLRIREKDNYLNFKNIWIVKEKKYHKEFKVKENADYIIDTSNLF